MNAHTRICSRHFHHSDFRITSNGKGFVKECAIPSLFKFNRTVTFRKQRSVEDIDGVQTLEANITAQIETTVEEAIISPDLQQANALRIQLFSNS